MNGNHIHEFNIENSKLFIFTLFIDLFRDVTFMRGRFWIFMLDLGIYTKKIDDSEPELFSDRYAGDMCWDGRILKPFFNEKYLLYLRYTHLVIIPICKDLTSGQVRQISVPTPRENYEDFASIEDKIFLLTSKKIIFLKMSKKKKISLKSYLSGMEVEGVSGREERLCSLSICQKKRFIMIHKQDEEERASSLLVYQFVKNTLKKKSILDIFTLEKQYFYSMTFLEYWQSKVYFAGFTHSFRDNTLVFYSYDMDANIIEEEESLGRLNIDTRVRKFVKKDCGLFVGISSQSNLLTIKFE